MVLRYCMDLEPLLRDIDSHAATGDPIGRNVLLKRVLIALVEIERRLGNFERDFEPHYRELFLSIKACESALQPKKRGRPRKKRPTSPEGGS
jgi:hypothetical protein